MQLQQRRLYAFAIGLVAVLTVGATLLPWVSLNTLGTPVGWNGIGRTGDAAFAGQHVGPNPYGWWVIAAAAVALLASLLLLGSGTTLRVAAWSLWLAALAALAATAVPITALVTPEWLIGGFIEQISLRPLPPSMSRHFLNVPVLGFVIGFLVLLAVLCIGTALTVCPSRFHIRISIDRDPKPAGRTAKPKSDDAEAVAPDQPTEDAPALTTSDLTTSDPETSDPAASDPETSDPATSDPETSDSAAAGPSAESAPATMIVVDDPTGADSLAMVVIDKTAK